LLQTNSLSRVQPNNSRSTVSSHRHTPTLQTAPPRSHSCPRLVLQKCRAEWQGRSGSGGSNNSEAQRLPDPANGSVRKGEKGTRIATLKQGDSVGEALANSPLALQNRPETCVTAKRNPDGFLAHGCLFGLIECKPERRTVASSLWSLRPLLWHCGIYAERHPAKAG
jgi:hypothetical protein